MFRTIKRRVVSTPKNVPPILCTKLPVGKSLTRQKGGHTAAAMCGECALLAPKDVLCFMCEEEKYLHCAFGRCQTPIYSHEELWESLGEKKRAFLDPTPLPPEPTSKAAPRPAPTKPRYGKKSKSKSRKTDYQELIYWLQGSICYRSYLITLCI